MSGIIGVSPNITSGSGVVGKFPSGYVLKRTNIFSANNSSVSNAATDGSWHDSGYQIIHTSVLSSTYSYFVCEWSCGLTFRNFSTASKMNMTIRLDSASGTWDDDDAMSLGSSYMEHAASHNTSQYWSRSAKCICGDATHGYSMPADMTTAGGWNTGQTLYFRLWSTTNAESSALFLVTHAGCSHTFSIIEIAV